jgi:competence protein ComEA
MFDSLTRYPSQERDASARLKVLAAHRRAFPAVPDAPEGPDVPEWIDETHPPPPPRSRLAQLIARWRTNRRWPVLACAMAVVAVCAAVGLSVARPEREAPPPLPAAAIQTSSPAPTTLVVSVVGRVSKPGLITLPEGARLADAIQAAGGASEADSLTLNMARRLADGEQIHVGVPSPPEAAQPLAKPAKVDLNSAQLSQLDTLPGVGEVTAQRIIDWRTQRGRFTSVEQLRQVDGIGESRFARLKELVTVN